uniref:Uncharacterized protein n=1 Tax=Setaria italica TaxID=4555 RepID=K3YBM1_SETIT
MSIMPTCQEKNSGKVNAASGRTVCTQLFIWEASSCLTQRTWYLSLAFSSFEWN